MESLFTKGRFILKCSIPPFQNNDVTYLLSILSNLNIKVIKLLFSVYKEFQVLCCLLMMPVSGVTVNSIRFISVSMQGRKVRKK